MFKNKRIRWISFIVLVLIVAAGGYYAYSVYLQPAEGETTDASEVQTAVARQGNLTVFASAVGSVVPATEFGVGFDESGTLIEILVKVGDEVPEGQLLARLDTGKSEEEIALSVSQAELNVLNAQNDLDDLYSSAQMNAALALQSVEDAQQTLDILQNTELSQAEALQTVVEAEQAVSDAQRVYNSVRATASQSTIDAAKAELVLAESSLKDARSKFNDYADKPDTNLIKANLQLKLNSAQSAYDTALSYYNAVTSTGSDLDRESSEADLLAAQAELAEAQSNLESVQAGATPGELAVAEAELATAQAEWEVLQDGPDPDEIKLAEAELANAKADFALAQEDQAIIELLAPMDGTIMSIDASVGEKIGTGSIITIADLSQPVLEVYLDETDLDMVGVGYEIDVTFDAFPEDVFTGHILEIDPSLQSVSGSQVIRVLAQLDADSFAKPQNLLVGMNAAVDVIGGRTENAVLVPVEALREIGTDEYAVFVMDGDQPKLRVVTVGLMDFTSAEITSGLEAGEIVTTGIVETQ
ncbi:MAG: HlyD family efflux transporter periplasmic adaptor subunit [Anaerolineales bacterium]